MSERLAVTEFIASETDDIRMPSASGTTVSTGTDRGLPPTVFLHANEQVRGGTTQVLYRL